jgi:hypothetical protein
LIVAAGLCTAVLQCFNHARADDLARLQREWEMRRAANEVLERELAAHVWGVARTDRLSLRLRAEERARLGAQP